MLTLLTKNYNKYRYTWLFEILSTGLVQSQQSRGCTQNCPYGAECEACETRTVCRDVWRLMAYLSAEIIGGDNHTTKTNGNTHNDSDRI